MRVFLSYTYTDQEFAHRLGALLEARRVRCFLGKSDLAAGEPLWNGLRNAIEAADALVLVLSPESAQDQRLLFEAGVAAAAHRPIVSVRLPVGEGTDAVRLMEQAAEEDSRFVVDGGPLEELATRVGKRVRTLRAAHTDPWWRRLLGRVSPS